MLRIGTSLMLVVASILMLAMVFCSTAGLGILIGGALCFAILFNILTLRLLSGILFAFVLFACVGLVLHALGLPFLIIGVVGFIIAAVSF